MRRLQLEATQIVVAAFQVRGANRSFENAFQQRDVFIENLILKGFSACRNENSSAMKQGRKQICQSLSGSGAGFDNDVILSVQSTINGIGHSDLRGPKLIVAQLLLQHPARAEELVHGPVSVYFRTPV